MEPELVNSILGLTKRMLTLKAVQEGKLSNGTISEREFMILSALRKNGRMNISDVAQAVPAVSYSTISTDITRLWRNKELVSKAIDPENQRVTLVELTENGSKLVAELSDQRKQRLEKLYEAMNPGKEEQQVIIRVFDRASKYFDQVLQQEKKD